MLADRPEVTPVRILAEALETRGNHGIASLTGERTALVMARPCRALRPTLSDVGLLSSGHVSTPGEVLLAHHGVRLLDE